MTRQHIVFLTGAGISAESGLNTFRGTDGLWTNKELVYLASTDAWYNDIELGFTHFKTTATEGMLELLEAFKKL